MKNKRGYAIRNLRNELKASQKIYFYDTGIRNGIISDFRPMELRQDRGAVFENYVVAELKKRFYGLNMWFWRNIEQQEIDFLVEKDGAMAVFEVKWSEKKTVKFPTAFMDAYRPAKTYVINSENCTELLGGGEFDFLAT